MVFFFFFYHAVKENSQCLRKLVLPILRDMSSSHRHFTFSFCFSSTQVQFLNYCLPLIFFQIARPLEALAPPSICPFL